MQERAKWVLCLMVMLRSACVYADPPIECLNALQIFSQNFRHLTEEGADAGRSMDRYFLQELPAEQLQEAFEAIRNYREHIFDLSQLIRLRELERGVLSRMAHHTEDIGDHWRIVSRVDDREVSTGFRYVVTPLDEGNLGDAALLAQHIERGRYREVSEAFGIVVRRTEAGHLEIEYPNPDLLNYRIL